MAQNTIPKNVPVALAAGTHTWFPTPESEAVTNQILDVLRKYKIVNLDTARSYGRGASERFIGNKGLGAEFKICTKAPGIIDGTGKRAAILAAAKKSLDALKVEKVAIYLLHAPDPTVPVAETMGAIQTLYEEGNFEKFGLSNFSREGVLEYYNYAKEHQMVLPTVYQSSYSLAVRLNEKRLFPTLRELGISIQAYSPMAGGFLAKTPADIEAGRGSWDPATPVGTVYRHLFYKPSYMKMLDEYKKLCEKSSLSRAGLAYRWVRYHSALKGELGDEMIIGAATAEQLEETVLELEKGPLEEWVVKRIDELWAMVEKDAPVDNLEAMTKLMKSM